MKKIKEDIMINKMKELFSGLHFTIISIAFFVLNVVLNLLKIGTVSLNTGMKSFIYL